MGCLDVVVEDDDDVYRCLSVVVESDDDVYRCLSVVVEGDDDTIHSKNNKNPPPRRVSTIYSINQPVLL